MDKDTGLRHTDFGCVACLYLQILECNYSLKYFRRFLELCVVTLISSVSFLTLESCCRVSLKFFTLRHQPLLNWELSEIFCTYCMIEFILKIAMENVRSNVLQETPNLYSSDHIIHLRLVTSLQPGWPRYLFKSPQLLFCPDFF